MRPIALCALLPLAAFAETSTPASVGSPATSESAQSAAAPQAPRWSIGAGVFSGSTTLLGSTPLYLGYPVLAQVPGPGVTASLERKLSDRTWLVLGVSGTIGRTDQELPDGYSGTTRNDVSELALSGGARYVLTPAGAPVDVSALALVDAGVLDARVEQRQFVGAGLQDVTYDTTGWLAGASFGVAVDRALTGGLSLRVATPLLGVSYTSTRTRVSGQQSLDGSDFTARVEIAPRLELRLAF